MNRLSYIIIFLFCAVGTVVWAGNPDRQGEAGAYELLINPWARSAGLHSMNTSLVKGIDAMHVNPAGLSRINKTEAGIGHTVYLSGTGIGVNSVGLSQRLGKNGALGISIMAMDFGDIQVTTTNQPEGTGGTFSPSFFNIGVGYSYTFENKISVGAAVRGISETTADVSALGFCIDAGVQYVTGPKDNFKFGVSLRNIGSKMRFNGEGLAYPTRSDREDYVITGQQRSAGFELPSVLNLGVSYDFLFTKALRLTAIGNFTSNAFGFDQTGAGIELALNEMFVLRGGYRHELGQTSANKSAYTGLCGGFTVNIPLSKENPSSVGLDYSYQATNPFSGTHNIGVRINL
ncbi:MAG: PorV/PorQ family protein [Saprospiraceae bacterium]|nr:PorV/PorQ family protein [Saprospiraceae bacterium]MBP7679683.1 PorV/PorQ family protein [Saprospiraceae bacterium]